MVAVGVVLIMLLVSSAALAQNAARPARGVPRAGELIRGHVVAADTGTPLRRVRIMLTAGGRREDAVLTDDEGRFAVAVSDPSAITLEASKAGYASTVARIGARDARRRLQIGLVRGAVITGAVIDESGSPVPFTDVAIRRVDSPPNGPASMSSWVFLQTNDDGTYRFAGLAAGEYTVSLARSPGDREAAVPAAPVTVAVETGATLEGVDLVFGDGFKSALRATSAALASLDKRAISGTVVDEYGEPMQGVTVEARQLRYLGRQIVTRVIKGARTDDRGHYDLRRLDPGTYVVAVLDDAKLSSESGGRLGYVPVYHPGTALVASATRLRLDGVTDFSGIDVALTPTFSARITGIALDSRGRPLRGSVTLGVSARSGALATDLMSVSTTSDGAFAFPDVPAGDYVVKARGASDLGRTGDFGVDYVSVGDRDPPPVTVRAAPQAVLEGVIVMDGAPQSTVNTVTIIAVPLDVDRAATSGEPSGTLAISSTGTFYMTGLQGPMRLALATRSESWYVKSITIGAVDATATGFDFGVMGDTFEDARIEVARATGVIAGSVVTAAPASAVVAFSSNRDDWFAASPYLKFARIAPDGSYRVEGVPPGDYWIAAVNGVDGTADGGEWQNPDVLETLTPGAQRLAIGDGQRVELRLVR